MRANKMVYNPYRQFSTLTKEQLQPINSIEASATAWAVQSSRRLLKTINKEDQTTLFTSNVKYVSNPKLAPSKYVFSGAIPTMLPSLLTITHDTNNEPNSVMSIYTLRQRLVHNSLIPSKKNIVGLFKLVRNMINKDNNHEYDAMDPDTELCENFKLHIGAMFHSWFYDVSDMGTIIKNPEEIVRRFHDVFSKLEEIYVIKMNSVSELKNTYHPLCVVSFKFEFPILYNLTRDSINKYIDKNPKYLEMVPKARLLYPHEQLCSPFIPLILTNVFHTLLQEQYDKHKQLAQQAQVNTKSANDLADSINSDFLKF